MEMSEHPEDAEAVTTLQSQDEDISLESRASILKRSVGDLRLRALCEVEDARAVFLRAYSSLAEGKFEIAFIAFDEIHRHAGAIHELAIYQCYFIGAAAASSLRFVLEGMVNPGEGSLCAVGEHLDILEMVFRQNIRGDESELVESSLEKLEFLRRLSIEESYRFRTQNSDRL
ncbi:MAG: hypothetical protein PSN37_01875 [Alphaproteobacteria bacterium]|nr:hypothetical protein [Alphaproteobacteria bacterium]